jgi:hypothetical protein
MVNVAPDLVWNSSVPDRVMTEPGDRVLVLLVRSARPCFLEGQLGDEHGLADEVASYPLGEIDSAFLEQRVTILACPNADTSDHSGSSSGD